MKEIADALNRIAEVHDRRLGEIANALSRLADQLTHNESLDGPDTGIDHLAREIGGLAGDISGAIDVYFPDKKTD